MPAMTNPKDTFLSREIPIIRKIIEDETWLEGERRHEPVSEEDAHVVENVCAVVLRVGADIRRSLSRG